MFNIRSEAMTSAYNKFKEDGGLATGHCILCEKPSIIEFKYWRIIKNDFPYDVIASVHDMILPKEHMKEKNLSLEMYRELNNIKDTYLNENYTHIIESLPKIKSIPKHFHLHLIKERK